MLLPPTEEEPDWNQIVDTHAWRVAQIALRILGCEHDAEEVAQEVFVEAFQLHRRETIRDWTGLLVRLATLRSLDRRRTRKEAIGFGQHDVVSSRQPFHSLQESELVDWLRTQVAQLPARQAAVITLTCFQEMSRDEVAAALDMTPENVSATLYQARRRLKESLALFDGGTK